MKTLMKLLTYLGVGIALSYTEAAFAQNPTSSTVFDTELNSKNIDVTLGWSQSNLSITKGVLIEAQFLPTFNANVENQLGFLSVQNGAGLWLYKSPAVKVGASVNYMLGRFERFDRRYTGLGDVAGSFDAYTWVEWQPIKDAVTVYANYARTLGASYRSYAQIGFTLGAPIKDDINFFADMNFNYANQTYVQKYYGIDAHQATVSARTPYTASQGGMLNDANLVGLDFVMGRDRDLILGIGQLKYSHALSTTPLIVQAHQKTLLLVWNQKLNH